MWFSDKYINQVFGDKEPDMSVLKTGEWVIYCRHCGYQHTPNCAINMEHCPNCRKRMSISDRKP